MLCATSTRKYAMTDPGSIFESRHSWVRAFVAVGKAD
jgi:hypothetical protein